jgi:hypothetical protein
LPEPFVPQPGDGELHLIDQQRTAARFGFGIVRLGPRSD